MANVNAHTNFRISTPHGLTLRALTNYTQTLRLTTVYFYRPRSKGDNTFGSVRLSVRPSVHLFVCLRSPV